MLTLKFGGTSMGSADRMLGSADIIINRAKEDRLCVIVSAVAGVSNTLQAAIEILQLINPLLAKALLRQRGQLYLCDVKSAAMLGCMMELKTFGKSQCLSRWKRFVE